MAEAIGLAFGGIALTGLVSSCVDILEYTNNARYWLYDLSLALTKVALLQCRLDSLREVCLAATAIGHDKSGEGSGDWTSSTGCNVAAQGLSGVKSVLEQTYKLCRRYSLAHMERGGHYHATHRLQAPALAASYLGEPHLIVALKPWRRLGRQLSWALQDKKKFDKLILDLDFLLSNTEQLFQRTTQLSGPVCQPQGQKQIATAPSYTTSKWLVAAHLSDHGLCSSVRTRLYPRESRSSAPKRSPRRRDLGLVDSILHAAQSRLDAATGSG